PPAGPGPPLGQARPAAAPGLPPRAVIGRRRHRAAPEVRGGGAPLDALRALIEGHPLPPPGEPAHARAPVQAVRGPPGPPRTAASRLDLRPEGRRVARAVRNPLQPARGLCAREVDTPGGLNVP